MVVLVIHEISYGQRNPHHLSRHLWIGWVKTVYDQQQSELMAAVNLGQTAPEGGFFPQAGTNLTMSALVVSHCSQTKKTES